MTTHRVLVVDDERLFRQQFSDLLEARNLEVETASSGEAAVRKAEQGRYDIVFLDLVMPDMDGQEALERMLGAKPNLNVVIVTAHGSIESAVRAMKVGAYYYLTKPVNEATLDVVIRNCQERIQLLRQNATLQEATLLDDQTSAYNRRYLDLYMEEELERARRYTRPFSVLFLDVYNLKAVNDRHGHLCGSRVLRELCNLVLKKIRKSDKIFRFGGDEFVITVPETDAEGAYGVGQRVRRAVRAHKFQAAEGLHIELTVSIGIAAFPQDGQSQEALLQRADAAMYQVKASTRDAVAGWGRA